MKQYVSVNGEYFPKDEPYFAFSHSLLRSNDAFFELMHANGGKVQFFDEHMSNILLVMKALKMQIPMHFYEPDNFRREFEKLLHRNRLFQGNQIKLTIFRDWSSGSKKIPGETSYIIEIEKVSSGEYFLNTSGYLIDIVKSLPKPKNILSNIRFYANVYHNLALLNATDPNLDDYLILNQDNSIIETVTSNIFLLRQGVFLTPKLEEGCISDIMRTVVKNILLKLKYDVWEITGLLEEHMNDAREAFLVNSIEGVRWVSGFRIKRYYNTIGKILTEKINEIATKS